MVRIRLQRRGYKKHHLFAVVAADSAMPRDGRFLEKLGLYDPHQLTDEAKFQVKKERISYWLSRGAQPSETVASFLKKLSIEVAAG